MGTACTALDLDLTLPAATEKKLYALAHIRYLWEMGARTRTQGQTLVINTTFPIPSMKV
jgi:hypothetical protein